MTDKEKKSVAIIGCGAAGLAALRHFTAEESQFTCVSYEQTDNVGGTWVYTDKVGKDKYGLPVHSSMYKSLRYLIWFARFYFFSTTKILFSERICQKKSWSYQGSLIKVLKTNLTSQLMICLSTWKTMQTIST